MTSNSSSTFPPDGTRATSTTAPGKIFQSRAELANHYKSDWHKYNLKRKQAGLPLLNETDFSARWEAAMALRQSKEQTKGTDHLKKHKQPSTTTKSNKHEQPKNDPSSPQEEEEKSVEDSNLEEEEEETNQSKTQLEEVTPDMIDPRQCLFDSHISESLPESVQRMQRVYGFFLPDAEYLVDLEGLLGYCHEKIKLGHLCLYCQKTFGTWQGCQKHMISKNHTKLLYEEGVDLEEYEVFYDFSKANAEYLNRQQQQDDDEQKDDDGEQEQDDENEQDWEDVVAVSDDSESEEEDVYDGYERAIAKFGFTISSIGEIVFPDGRIVGHRALNRYYKQRITPRTQSTAVSAASRAAGDRLYNGRVYNIQQQNTAENALVLARAGVAKGATTGRASNGVLVPTGGGGFSALSLYRYKAVVKKQRRDDAVGQRLQYKSRMNHNRMDKKANRLMNDVCVAKAPR